MTEEHKQKLREGRARAKLEGRVRKPKEKKVKTPVDKTRAIVVHLTGKEQDSYDFFTPIRKAYRNSGNYAGYPKILKELSASPFNKNPRKLREILQGYCKIEVDN